MESRLTFGGYPDKCYNRCSFESGALATLDKLTPRFYPEGNNE
jgi:hypothetical protein